jgi:nucleoside-diphosphate-sugar epimerase
MKILVTGATGFIGRHLIDVIKDEVEEINILVRPNSLNKAQKLFSNINNINYILGDVYANDVCHKIDDFERIITSVDTIVHLAAKYDITMSAQDAYTNNVIGVQNVLTLARRMKKLKYFHHISSYSVNAHRNGDVAENDLSLKANYNDHYAKSKMQGEYMVRTMELPDVKKRIYRPGIVVGHSLTGEIDKVDGPYYFLRLIYQLKDSLALKTKYFPLPFGPQTVFPIIPVDHLVAWLKLAVIKPNNVKIIECYHMVPQKPVMLKDFVELCLELNGFKTNLYRFKRVSYYKYLLPLIGMPRELLFYMYSNATYKTDNLMSDFPEIKIIEMGQYLDQIIKGCEQYFKSHPDNLLKKQNIIKSLFNA